MACDPNFADVALLFNCDGTNGSAVFTDLSPAGNVLTPHASGATVSTTNPKFGTGCFNGTGDTYIDTPITPGSPLDLDGDFTIEAWVRWDSLFFGSSSLYQVGDTVAGAAQLSVGHTSAGQAQVTPGGGIGSWDTISMAGAFASGSTYYHVAVVRSGSNGYLFVNGIGAPVQAANWTGVPTWGAKMSFGGTYTGSGIGIIGATDEYRVTRAALYTADFTPPTEPFSTFGCTATCDPDFASVVLLVPFDGTNGSTDIPDWSLLANPITAHGTAALSTSDPQFGSAALAVAGGGFDYVDFPTTPDNDLSDATAFTLEGWFRPTDATDINELTLLGTRRFPTAGGFSLYFQGGTPGSQGFRFQIFGAGSVNVGGTPPTISSGSWHYFAVVFDGTDVTIYLDGVFHAQGSTSGPFDPQQATVRLGADSVSAITGNSWNGQLDEIRFTKNVARYTADFTPPAAPFPNHECTSPQVDVPDVVGESLADATDDIEAVLLVLGTVTYEYSDSVPAGDVISQDPAGGETVDEGSSVDLVVSLGAASIVPDVLGLSQADATTAIVGAGLVLGAVTSTYSDTVPQDAVISSDPIAGTEVAPGSDVDIVLSLGPPPVTVPNVVNSSQADAALILASFGLTVGALSNGFSDEVPAGHVISQSPVAGTIVAVGAPVDLVISLGPAAVVVPDVVGLTSSVAAEVLRAAGLRVGRITVDTSGATPLGLIASQFANAGALVPSGTKIALVLSAIAPPFDVETTVISQYAQSPTLVELVDNMAEYIDPRTNLTEFYAYVWNVDTATGFGLDVWGKIVGVGRLLRIVADDPIFGFDNASTPPPDWQPWSQGRFARNTGEGGEAVILPDDAYRVLILTKALANIAATNSQSINQLLKNLFPGRGKAYVEDLGGMAMRFVFDFVLTPVEYAIVSQSGALPHPAGVSLSVSVPP